MLVCEHCLFAIEAHEGKVWRRAVHVDECDGEESRCEWCEEHGFDILYEIQW